MKKLRTPLSHEKAVVCAETAEVRSLRKNQIASSREARQIPVFVVLPPRLLLLDVAGPLEVLRQANRVQGFEDENDLGSQHIGMMVNTIAGYSFVDRAVGGKFALRTAPVPAGPKGPAVEMFGTNACVFSKAARALRTLASVSCPSNSMKNM